MQVLLENSYEALPERFHARHLPARFPAPKLITYNRRLVKELGLAFDGADDDELATVFSGQRLFSGSAPIAMAYAGHQFGHFVPQLGDGRALLLGEVLSPSGQRFDLHLKGAGQTAFSRGGDGRSALGPVLREYIVSEAMHALGVPTTRALAAVTTGERVNRGESLPGAVMLRVASSHVRVGSFEYFASRGDVTAVKILADYIIERHDPQLKQADNPYLELLKASITRQARLIAHWMRLGFIHGVMNTDNTQLYGETLDYGPCAFMDSYDPTTVFSSIDRHGRYAYSNQPKIAQWNLARFAETLLPLIDDDKHKAAALASDALSQYISQFEDFWLKEMGKKLGLRHPSGQDQELIKSLLEEFHQHNIDYTLGFRSLYRLAISGASEFSSEGVFSNACSMEPWFARWQQRLQETSDTQKECLELMRQNCPVIIPRNHLVARAIKEAEASDDFSFFQTLIEATSNPYEETDTSALWEKPPLLHERVHQTFCGT